MEIGVAGDDFDWRLTFVYVGSINPRAYISPFSFFFSKIRFSSIEWFLFQFRLWGWWWCKRLRERLRVLSFQTRDSEPKSGGLDSSKNSGTANWPRRSAPWRAEAARGSHLENHLEKLEVVMMDMELENIVANTVYIKAREGECCFSFIWNFTPNWEFHSKPGISF